LRSEKETIVVDGGGRKGNEGYNCSMLSWKEWVRVLGGGVPRTGSPRVRKTETRRGGSCTEGKKQRATQT